MRSASWMLRHRTLLERAGDVVYRTAGPWSTAVIALLTHLERTGFAWSPRPVGSGFAADGREALGYVPGSTPHPQAWGDGAARQIGVALRSPHEATRGFAPPPGSQWKPWYGRSLGGTHPVIGHCDLGPWNVMAVAGWPTGFIDWEFAGPVDAHWELAQVAWLNAHLHDDDVAERVGLPAASVRARQLALIADGYEMPRRQRADLVDMMIEFAVHSATADAVEYGVEPDTTSGAGDDGFPFVWGITWRVRSASWMLRHRTLLERAVMR